MVALTTLARYIASRMEYSVNLSFKNFQQGVKDVDVWKNFFQGKLTYVHWTKGEEMAPTIGPQGGTLLVRRLISPDSSRVDVGDVVVLKDPENSDNLIVRRLAAVEGYEMVSKDEKDEPFVLDDDECWVVADNENMKPKQEAYDSRTFGPVSMSNIVGRVLYCLRNAVDHGPVNNRFALDLIYGLIFQIFMIRLCLSK
ncbi:OLC1v1007025C2 [Oldenlandia corymbosa var. corymbosa]|uniref:OLC1v1007025C2 n=1 Tax=Oldenlandia corymbosa var. corymbosa TaxID=529605 RepID=A0AAV1DLE4_OLDCO|nr:OLC1v1007025C2 [Oldenlandia corymbosa var. corymbosa]